MSSLEAPYGRLELVAFFPFFFVFPSIILLLLSAVFILDSSFRPPLPFVPCNLCLRLRHDLATQQGRFGCTRFSGGGGEAGSSVGLGGAV